MRKIFIAFAFLGSFLAHAQSQSEIKVNMLNVITRASVEVGYEYFTSPSGSLDFEILLNDRFAYYEENDTKEFKTNSVSLGYNFYFSYGQGVYVSPFAKYRFGDYEERNNNVLTKTDMNSFILGLEIGYKWVWNNQFAFGPYFNIARNFSDEVSERFEAVEGNAGVSIGIRF